MHHFIEQIYRNSKNYRGIIFLDRDGTLNEEVEYLFDQKQLNILPAVIDAIRFLNERHIAVVVITNQPVIARGLATPTEVKKINDTLVERLRRENAFIDAIYSCPHHPEKDHRDIPPQAMQYRIVCECRKPGTLMLKKALEVYKNLKVVGMIGDHKRDIQTAKAINAVGVLINAENNKIPTNNDSEFVCDNLLDAVNRLLSR